MGGKGLVQDHAISVIRMRSRGKPDQIPGVIRWLSCITQTYISHHCI